MNINRLISCRNKAWYLILLLFIAVCNCKKPEQKVATVIHNPIKTDIKIDTEVENEKAVTILDTNKLEKKLKKSLVNLDRQQSNAKYRIKKISDGVEGKSTEFWNFDNAFSLIFYSNKWYESIYKGSKYIEVEDNNIKKMIDSTLNDGRIDHITLINTEMKSIQGLKYVKEKGADTIEKNWITNIEAAENNQEMSKQLNAVFSKIKQNNLNAKQVGDTMNVSIRLEGIPESYGKFYEKYSIDKLLFDYIIQLEIN